MAEAISGTCFPFRIDAATGGVARASGSDKLRQNVRVILGTRFGERPMLRDFGTRIAALVHDPNDAVLGELIQTQAQQALLRFEPRILVTSTKVVQSGEGEVSMLLNYTQTTAPIADQLILPLF